MSEVVKIDGLEKAVERILKDYDEEVINDLRDVLPNVGKEVAKQVKANAIRQGLKSNGGGKHYVNGWRVQAQNGRLTTNVVVYNALKPQLTHLLENGHAKKNGRGRVEGRPHIAPANEWAENEVIKEIERRLSE